MRYEQCWHVGGAAHLGKYQCHSCKIASVVNKVVSGLELTYDYKRREDTGYAKKAHVPASCLKSNDEMFSRRMQGLQQSKVPLHVPKRLESKSLKFEYSIDQ